jgi:hypothetical protein
MSCWLIAFKRSHCKVFAEHLKTSEESLEVGHWLTVHASKEKCICGRVNFCGQVPIDLANRALDGVVAIELRDNELVNNLSGVI